MDYELLKKLCLIPSVTGGTRKYRDYLKSYLKTLNIIAKEDKYGNIIFGNLKKPKRLFASHLDEVGFQVTKIHKNGNIQFLPVGWVFPNRLDHSFVTLYTDESEHFGLVIHNQFLKADNIKEFSDLYIDLGYQSKKEIEMLGIRPGVLGTYKKDFFETKEKIIASSLDNKISQFISLEIIKKNRSVLEQNMFAFIVDEEMQDHGANGLCFRYSPEYVFVLDYCPAHQAPDNNDILGSIGNGPAIPYRGGNYILHEEMRLLFDKKVKSKFQKIFLSEKTLPSLEPNNYENNGFSKAANISVQALGYHGVGYSVLKKDIVSFYDLVLELSNI